MTRFASFAAVLITLLAPVGGPAQEATPEELVGTMVPADDPAIAVMGRVASLEGGAQMGFPGVRLRFVYRGPAPTLLMTALSEECYFDVSVDGERPVTMRLGEGLNAARLPFHEGGSDGTLVELTRRTESMMGEVVFHGLSLPEGGELLPPPPWPARRMLFIGDSVVSGAYNERFPPEERLTPATSNAGRSFAMILAERFQAQAHLVAYAGRGIARSASAEPDSEAPELLAPELLELATPGLEAVYWDHSRYTPEVIVINFGSDLTEGLPEVGAYAEAYQGFVMRVRVLYPLSYIVLAESSLLSDEPGAETAEAREQLRLTLEAVVARSRQAGDQRILLAEARHYPGTQADGSLIAHQHHLLADEIGAVIAEVTGWRQSTPR